MAEFDYNKVIQDQINAALNQIHEGIEAGCVEILQDAYEAGYDRGSDDEAFAARGVGPHTHRPPSFEEWVELVKGSRR